MTEPKIAVIGLGYVGLPLAVALSRAFDVRGYDANPSRVDELREGLDSTNEVGAKELADCQLTICDSPADLAGSDIFIVTVPTPVDSSNRPDLRPLTTACATIGPHLSVGNIVAFESTVYPGVTEEICGPALERASGLRAGADFKLGYSPERINPGDREHRLDGIVKVVAAQDDETLDLLSKVYAEVVTAGVHRASSIKVAETAKVIENTQRDLNIALMNELSKICDMLGISTSEVLTAAATKWNFVRFHPGLVGGHCIGVDPYYLTAKAEQIGYEPEVILAGRRINDGMGAYVGQRILKLLAAAGHSSGSARIGILGLTFKPNVPDVRNSKVTDVCRELREFGADPFVHDPIADLGTVKREYGVDLVPMEDLRDLHALVLAVPHDAYLKLGSYRLCDMVVSDGIMIDLYSKLDRAEVRKDLHYWSL